jgi:hypothetical protein
MQLKITKIFANCRLCELVSGPMERSAATRNFCHRCQADGPQSRATPHVPPDRTISSLVVSAVMNCYHATLAHPLHPKKKISGKKIGSIIILTEMDLNAYRVSAKSGVKINEPFIFIVDLARIVKRIVKFDTTTFKIKFNLESMLYYLITFPICRDSLRC